MQLLIQQKRVHGYQELSTTLKKAGLSSEPFTSNANVVLNALKTENNQALGQLKDKSALSGKKWDAAMKGLAKHGLTKVMVDGENKLVVLG